MLVRGKKGVSSQDRARSYFNSPVFDRLNEEKPENLKKIIFIDGELTQTNIGINSKDLELIQEEVSIVFHLAATIKFNEPLSLAVKINIEGTKEVLRLSRNIKQIEAFVYMSTIFANTTQEQITIEEKFYPSPKPLEEVYNMIQDNDVDEVFSSETLNGRPNTYTYTKVLAEHLIASERGDLPTIIVRPSVVTPAKEEPVKGWMCNWMGPTPILYLLGKGWCRSLYGKGHYTFEIIPVDYVVNLTIIAAARHNRTKEIAIYNCCTSSANPLTLRQTADHFLKACRIQRFYGLPFPGMVFTTSEWTLAVRRFLLEILPSYIADCFLFIRGKPTRFKKMQEKVALCASAIKYFSTQSWLMKMPRGQELFRSLSSTDQSIFPCDPAYINWENYVDTYLHGIRNYLLKGDTIKAQINN